MFTAALIHNSQTTQMSTCDAGAFWGWCRKGWGGGLTKKRQNFMGM